MVNLLHKKLPRLVLVISCTCNSFDASWIRSQWTVVTKLWCEHCEASIGLIIGYALDGDSRRRQLMLERYTSREGTRYDVLWEGSLLTTSVYGVNDVSGLHD